MATKKIAFVKLGRFSHINESVLWILETYFSDFEVEIIDIQNLIEIRKDPLNIIFAFKEYGLDILTRKRDLRKCLYRTSYIFKKVRRSICDRLSPNEYLFSFQTQSLFDTSVPGLPNFVYTDHTHLANLYNPLFYRKDLYSTFWLELEKTIYQNATLNFTMSENISKSIVEQYSCGSDKVVCVYAGSNAPIDNIKINPAKYANKNILFVGIDWVRKGGEELVEAFRIVLRTHPDAQLTIVGCFPELDIPNSNVVGRIPLEEVNKYYEEASVFCLPTKAEPLGIVFIEAFAHKLPIIATNIEAVPEFILDGESGYLIEPNHIEKFARALIDLIGNPKKCLAFGEKGHLIVKRYTWEAVGARIKQSIMSVVDVT